MATPPTPKFNIKRIKLLVRPPPPSYSHPLQRPAAKAFNGNLHEFLTSYISFNDNDARPEALREAALHEAALRARIEVFRRAGRLDRFMDADASVGVAIGNAFRGDVVSKRVDAPHKDAWGAIVSAAIAKHKARKVSSSGKWIAGQIASKVQGYWESFAAKEDKLKAQEEKKLRALARATIKLVTDEWKKAVFVSVPFLCLQAESMLNRFPSTYASKNACNLRRKRLEEATSI